MYLRIASARHVASCRNGRGVKTTLAPSVLLSENVLLQNFLKLRHHRPFVFCATCTVDISSSSGTHGNFTLRYSSSPPLFNPANPQADGPQKSIKFLIELQRILSSFHNLRMAPETMSKVSAVNGGGLGKKDAKGERAYVTFLAGDGDYVKGAVGLAKGLRKVRSAYTLVVAVLPDVPEAHRKLLEKQGCVVREIQPVYPPENQTQFAMAYYVINYSKLRIWQFVEYSKMIYLDADIQVYENIDHLFDLPDGHFYAVMDCFCEKTWSHTPQYEIGYCQQCPDKVTWSEELGPKPALYFNAGMFVHEPSLGTCEKLLAELRVTAPTPFAEQDFLNMFFRDIYNPIPLSYNLVLAMLWRHPENVELEKVNVVHYCAAGSKPWRYTGKEDNMDREDIKMLVKKWWDVYNDESLDYKGTADGVEARAERKQPFLAALSEAGVVHYITAPSAA